MTATASTDAGSEYEVVQGDTLVDIAREHGLELAQLRSLNPQVDPRRLQIGQKLRVAAPGNERRGDAGPAEQMRGEKSTTRGSTTAASGPGPGTSAPSAGEYTIRAGDTLFSIAREHQIRLADLRAWNPQANPRRLQVGQTLRLAPR